jgi:hypothetical protein
MIGVIASEKSEIFERMGMKLYIWMRPGLIRIMPLTICGYQLMVLMIKLKVSVDFEILIVSSISS